MPEDLQADVIVPIVNFMYTGTLEFHYSMYEKLLKTAREMNMTVLSKLLEAHRQTSSVTKVAQQQQPVLLNKNAAVNKAKVFTQKPLPAKTVIYKQGQTIIKHVSPNKANIPEPIQIVTRFQDKNASSRPSRFIVPDEIVTDAEGSFEDLSYESKPLQTASREEENSPFESLRRGYTNKRAAAAAISSQSPPPKKPNLEDIKAEAEAQSQRSEIKTGEDIEDGDDEDDDPDYDADQFFYDDGSEEEGVKNNQKSSPSGTVIKQTTKQITVSDCSGGNIDHAKILGEVLKKYPNLVKNPKNIKLKIMQKPSSSNSQQTTAIVRVIKQDSPSSSKIITASPHANQGRSPNNTVASSQPKKIDAKTMHELIKMGAENMKGPWLCLECGSGGRPISIPSYKKFRTHLINIHKQKIDPRICEHCGMKPARRIELIQHQLVAHNINPPADVTLFRCTSKGCVFVSQKEELLMKHKREVHKEFQQKCKYCSKIFNKEFLLHAHMRAVHRHMAKTDGVMEFSEDEEYEPNMAGNIKESTYASKEKKTNKIEILSNVEIPAAEALELAASVQMISQPSSEAEALTNVASGIATSIALVDNVDDQFNIEQQLAQVHGELPKTGEGNITRLVAEDGSELQLTAEQKEEILQQLQQQGATLNDNVVMVLDQRHVDGEDFGTYAESQESVPIQDNPSSTLIRPEELEKAEIVFENEKEKEVKEKLSADLDEKSRLIADLEGDWAEEERSQELKVEQENVSQESKNETPSEVEAVETSETQNDGKSNEELKDILNDWGDDEGDENAKLKEDLKDSDEKLSPSVEKISDENQTTSTGASVPDDVNETKNDAPHENNIPVVKSDNDDDSKKLDETVVVANDKSKIINQLLDEWNDL